MTIPSTNIDAPAALIPEAPTSGNGLVPTEMGNSGQVAVEAGAPPVLSSAPTPWALLMALRRRWVPAVGLGLVLAAVGAVAGWLLSPVSWRARTVLHISSSRPFILFEQKDGVEFANYQRAQVFLVKSRLVLNAALRDPEVASVPKVQSDHSPVEWLDKELKVDFGAGSEILTISMNGDQPDTMVKLVNAVRDAYMREIVNKEQNQRLKRLDQLQKLYIKFDDSVREKQKTLKELAEKLGTKNAQGLVISQKFHYENLEFMQREMLQYQSQIRKLQIELQTTQSKLAVLKETNVSSEAVEERLRQHPVVGKLQASILESQTRMHSLKEKLRQPESDSSFMAASNSLAQAREDLQTRTRELRTAIAQQLREEMLAQAKSAEIMQKEQLTLVQNLEKFLREQVNKKSSDVLALGKIGINVEFLDAETAQTEDVHKRIAAQKEAVQVEIDAPARVSILEEGFAVPTRDQKSRITMAGMGGMGLFGLAVLGVALLEFRYRRVSGYNEIVDGLGLSLVGVVPHMPARALSVANKRSDGYRHQQFAESIDATRTMLIHAARDESLRVVMVTSAAKGEGKTLVSSHLAASMALAGFKTLLIDADFRRSSVHRLFDLPVGPGLSELLRGQAPLESVLHPEPLPGLTVMTAGLWDTALPRALAQQKLGPILDSLRNSYDFIIVDTAPVLPTTDTLMIARHADGILLSVLCDVSRLPAVHMAQQRLAMLGARILGAVVGGAVFDRHYGDAEYGATAATSA